MNETDRELLEFAAKAAGLHRCENYYTDAAGNHVHWNPITDDGDAFRLMVKCGFFSYEIIPEELSSAFLQSDPYAATRRAITLAAAEIGRNMK